MGQRLRAAVAVGLLLTLPLSCGKSGGSDDDDAGSDSGAAGEGGLGGKAGGGAVLGGTGTGGSTPGGGSSGQTATGGTSSGGTNAGSGASAGTLTLPGGGRSLNAGGRGGSAGTPGGAAGKGGATGGGSGGGAGEAPALGALGSSCKKDADCDDPALLCLRSSDLSDGSGPAGGLCTKACETADDCADYGATYCMELAASERYCVQACTTGTAGSPKCREREDVACSLVGLRSGGTSCESTADCPSGSLCDPSTLTCGQSVTGCVPLCAGDFQCESGQFCDFTTGLCVSAEPVGLPLGSACTLPQGGADPCQGFCDAGSDGQHGICEALCTLQTSLAGCGWDGGSSLPDNVCLFGTVLSPPGDAVFGDVGICGALCDCNADCLRNGDFCVDESGGNVRAIWNRQGYCRPLDTTETQADTFASCGAAGGQAGAGG